MLKNKRMSVDCTEPPVLPLIQALEVHESETNVMSSSKRTETAAVFKSGNLQHLGVSNKKKHKVLNDDQPPPPGY